MYLTYEKWFKVIETIVKKMFSKIANCLSFRIESRANESKTIFRKANKINQV